MYFYYFRVDLESGIIKVYETKNSHITKSINYSVNLCSDTVTFKAVSIGVLPRPKLNEIVEVDEEVNLGQFPEGDLETTKPSKHMSIGTSIFINFF